MAPERIDIALAGGALTSRIGKAPGIGGDLCEPFRQRPLAPRQRAFKGGDNRLGHRDAAAISQAARELSGTLIANMQRHQ